MHPNKKQENPLWEYFKSNDKLLIHKWVHYFDIYHRHLMRFRETDCVVVEIGVGEGGSLQMWRNYFGLKAEIIGIDTNKDCKKLEKENFKIFIGSQSDRDFLRDTKIKVPKIDILIDDGGHTMEQQITTFEELFYYISENGIYLCEDVHTSYKKEYGGGLRKKGTFIEYSKNLIDDLNAYHTRDKSEFTKTALSIHYYDSLVVIEKGNHIKLGHEKTGQNL